MTYTAEQKLASLRREIKMRKRVYPRWVSEDRMTLAQAEYEIDIFEVIARDYKALAEKERLI